MSFHSSSRVQKTEEELSQILSQLRADIEEADFSERPVQNQKLSSFRVPKGIDHFRRERKLAIDKLLQTPQLRQVDVQAHVFKEELEVYGRMEYTSKSLAALLHQFYLNRIEQLVQCKCMHQMRWLRYGSNNQVMQRLQSHYQSRMQAVMLEYHDAVERARRLSACMEQLLAGGSPSPSLVTQQDVVIYLRYLVTELHALKEASAYLKVVQLLPHLHQNTMSMLHDRQNMSTEVKTDQKEQLMATVRKRWQDAARRARHLSSSGQSIQASQSPYAIDKSNSESAGSTSDKAKTPERSEILLTSWLPSPSSSAEARIPSNTSDLKELRPLLDHLMLCYHITMSAEFLSSADELELFYIVNRKLKSVFQRQEEKLTFHTLSGSNEDLSEGATDRKLFRKESLWLPYVKIRPERTWFENSLIGKLQTEDFMDPLLLVLSHALNLADIQKLQYALKRHAAEVRQDVCSSSSQSVAKTTNVWKNIFSGFDPHDPSFNPYSQENSSPPPQDYHNTSSSGIQKLDGLGNGLGRSKSSASDFDFGSAAQLLEGKEGALFGRKTALESTYKDGFMSFLYLRHLRIRDLRIKCLSILNYFRSVQRTLTVNDSGVLCMSSKEQTSGQSPVFSGASYMYNTAAECKLDWALLMEANEAEHCDDFYSVDDDGCLIVQDKNGCHVVYDSAIDDFRQLEHQMLLVGSYYIEKAMEKMLEKRSMLRENKKSIDRFGVLFDLWNQESLYLENKRKLVNCYLEAYHNVFDPREKQNLAQVMTNIMFSRPRFDPSSDYFLRIYRDECLCLQLQNTLVVKILNKQIDSQRLYLERILPSRFESPEEHFGLPLDIVAQQPVALTDASPVLKPVYLLEFHPSLCLASRLPQYLSSSLDEILHMFKTHKPTVALKFHIQMLQAAHQEWDLMRDIGSDYTKTIQDSLFSDIVCEDPRVFLKISLSLCERLQQHGQLSQTELQDQRLKAWTRVLEIVQLRHQLVSICHETSLLVKVYRRQASDLGFGVHHAFLRAVQLEQPMGVAAVSSRLPAPMGLSKQDDSVLDRFTSTALTLSVHEMDENQVGLFSFRSKQAIEQLLQGEGIRKMHTVLKMQLANRDAFLVAVQQSSLSALIRVQGKPDKSELEELACEGSSHDGGSTVCKESDPGSDLAGQLMRGFSVIKHKQNCFISVQLLKTPARQDAMVQYSKKPANVLKDRKEREKAKLEAINFYAEKLVSDLAPYSLRVQIIAFLDSLRNLLSQFPSVRDAFFQIGCDPTEDEQLQQKQLKKGLTASQMTSHSEDYQQKSCADIVADRRNIHMRPQQMMSNDGEKLLNLWYLPHSTEAVTMFSTLPCHTVVNSLETVLKLVSSLHTIVMFITAYAKLGDKFCLKLKSKRSRGASWSGAEHFGSEINDLQENVARLSDPQDPIHVAEYLDSYKQLLFQEFFVATAYNLRDSLLHIGMEGAFQNVSDGIAGFLKVASRLTRGGLMLPSCTVPDPFIPSSVQAVDLFPRRSMLSRVGLQPGLVSEHCKIGHAIYSCLSCLNHKGRDIASGEIMSVNLMLREVLENLQKLSGTSLQDAMSGHRLARSSYHRRWTLMSVESQGFSDEHEQKIEKAMSRSTTLSSFRTRPSVQWASLNPTLETRHLLDFLTMTSQLENLKQKWGQHLLELPHHICTGKHYSTFQESYLTNVLEPVKHSFMAPSAEHSFSESRRPSFHVPETDLRKSGVTESQLRKAQVDYLLELLETYMIEDTKRHFDKMHDLVLAERLRDDDNLPLDLWKTVLILQTLLEFQQTKEMCMVQRPLLVGEFSSALLSNHADQRNSICLPKDHLNSCLTELAANLMHHEKMVFRSYSSFYESMLRQQYSALQVKQKEVEKLKDELTTTLDRSTVQFNCHIADKTQQLLQQIVELKAKCQYLEKQLKVQEIQQSEAMKKRYDVLVHRLFSSTAALKGRFEEYRSGLYDGVISSVKSVRSAAIEGMRRIRRKAAAGLQDDSDLEQSLIKVDCDVDIQRENAQLTEKLMKLRMVNAWRHSSTRSFYGQQALLQLADAHEERDDAKTDLFNVQMEKDEEIKSLKDEIAALRMSLQQTEEQRQALQMQLSDERKVYSKRLEQLQEMNTQPKVDRTKLQDIDQLSTELENHRLALRTVSEQREMSERRTLYEKSRSQKTTRQLQQQLEQERSLKREAFHLVSGLQEKVNDFENSQYLPHRSVQSAPASGRVGISSPPRRSVTTSRQSPRAAWSPARSSSTPDPSGSATVQVKLQRPKTSGGQLRSRLAESLMSSDPNMGSFGEEEVRTLSEGNLFQ